MDDRIKLISTKNRGVSSARNTGLSISKGNYILFVDPDDWIELCMVEKLYANIINNQADISVCNYYKVIDNNKYSNNLSIEPVFDTKKFLNYVFDTKYFGGYACNKLFSRDIIFNNGFIKFSENVHVCEDLLFNFHVSLNTKKICYTDEKLYNYFQRENSASLSKFNIKYASKLLIFEDLIKIAEKYDVHLSKSIMFEYVYTAMDIKYKMYKSGLLRKDIDQYLKSIRNKYIIEALRSINYSLLKKSKLIMICYANYLYGSLKSLK